jgi:hypothetical protein
MAKPGHSGLCQLSHHSPNLSPMSLPAAPAGPAKHCPAQLLDPRDWPARASQGNRPTS